MSKSNYKIVITGGGTGIGAALALDLSSEGNSVIICGRRVERLRDISSKDEKIAFCQCDVSDEDSVVTFKKFVSEKFDHIDVLINCAGLYGAIGRFDQTDSKIWKKTIDINLFGTYLVTKHLLPLLLRSNVKKIINFSGGGAFGVFLNFSAYAASKAAVVRFSENIAHELEDLGVQVNCVAPGFVATEIHEETLNAGEEKAGTTFFKETKTKLKSGATPIHEDTMRAGPDKAGEEYFQYTQRLLREGAVPMEVPVACVRFLLSEQAGDLTGKTISASFDPWGTHVFQERIAEINQSDLYTLRRINLLNLPDSPLKAKLVAASGRRQGDSNTRD